MSVPVLTLADVSVQLGDTPVLREVRAAIHPGECVAVLGPNGAGKTTLLRAIAGLQPASGTIDIAGRALSQLTLSERARQIGYLPQGHQTHWPLRVREIVGLGRFAHGAYDPARLPNADKAIVTSAMAAAGITTFAERRATDLSGGERARVALARVLAQDTPLVLADEPTASLDPKYQLEVMELLAAMARDGRTVLAVLHDLDLAMRFATRVLVLDHGRCVADGPPADVLGDALCHRVFGIVRAGTTPAWRRAP